MAPAPSSNPYSGFQADALAAIEADFRSKRTGRYLLVVPTGGGKTRIAVQAVCRLFDAGILDLAHDRVAWVAHRTELLDQARKTFRLVAEQGGTVSHGDSVDFLMLKQVASYFQRSEQTRIAVVDEAHHAAAASYEPIFTRTGVGVLGLTATPSRHDGKPLDFEKESYSIGFPDLVNLGVLIRPEVIQIKGGTYDIGSLSDDDCLESLNNAQRNERILRTLENRAEDFTKVIVYVGTVAHARHLYRLLKAAPFAHKYEMLACIDGDQRARILMAAQEEFRGEERGAFIDAIRGARRSIILNVDVLTEGYDDPAVNTVVMARPTRSKLVYMQAMGRAVRLDLNDDEKQAFVVEVDDDLPNIRYRIDNRWLYSDVSDQLEPDVVDRYCAGPEALGEAIGETFDEYRVPSRWRHIPETGRSDRVTMLLFKVYAADGKHEHLPLVITNATRPSATAFFNRLSAQMAKLIGKDTAQVFGMVRESTRNLELLRAEREQRLVQHALENAWKTAESNGAETTDPVIAHSPWVTFVAFRYNATSALSDDLLAFTDDMVNAEHVRDTLRSLEFCDGHYLVRLPLALRGTWGKFLSPAECGVLRSTVEQLEVLRDSETKSHQWERARAVLDEATLPFEQKYRGSLTNIVRESMDYLRELKK